MLNVHSFQHFIVRVIEKTAASCSLPARQKDSVSHSLEYRAFCHDLPRCAEIPCLSPHADATLALMPSRSFDQFSPSEPI